MIQAKAKVLYIFLVIGIIMLVKEIIIPFLILFILAIILFNGIGFLSKSLKATGMIKKKFLYLAFGFILFAIVVTFDALVPPGILLSIVRFGIIVSSILLYIGIKT